MQDIRIERIIIIGDIESLAKDKVKVIEEEKEWETTVTVSPSFKGTRSNIAGNIVIRDPKVHVGKNWEIQF